MKISFSVSELNAALKNVYKAVDTHGVSAWMSGILLETDNEDGLIVTGTNGSQTITQRVTCNVIAGGKALLDGKLLASVVAKLPTGECTLDATDKKKATIKTRENSTNISLLDPSSFVTKGDCEGETKAMLVNAADFISALKTVIYAVAIQDTRHTLMGVNMSTNGNSVHICGLSGVQMAVARFSTNASGNDWNIIIPRKVISDIISLIPVDSGEVAIQTDDRHCVFSYGNMHIKTQLIAGEFIRYQQVIENTAIQTKVLFDTKLLKNAVERVMILGEGKNKLLRVEVDEDGVVAVSARGETGDAVERIDCSVDGPPMAVHFNGQFVLDSLGVVGDEKAVLSLSTPSGAAFIKADGKGNWLHCLLPVRAVG